MEMWFC